MTLVSWDLKRHVDKSTSDIW